MQLLIDLMSQVQQHPFFGHPVAMVAMPLAAVMLTLYLVTREREFLLLSSSAGLFCVPLLVSVLR